MSKFCGKCGSPLDDNGKCPKCDSSFEPEKSMETVNDTPSQKEEKVENVSEAPAELSKKEKKKADKAERKRIKKEQKKAKRATWSVGKKIRRFLFKWIVILLVIAILIGAGAGALVYFDIISIPFVEKNLISIGLIADSESEEEQKPADVDPDDSGDDKNQVDFEDTVDDAKVEPIDSDEYYKNNAQVITETNANDSDKVLSESEVYDKLTALGFEGFPITTEYSMDGQYGAATEISLYSSQKHPMYNMYYYTENGNVWNISVIESTIFATPISYNIQSNQKVQVVLSETDTVTSYDNVKNKFFVTKPNTSTLIVKTLSGITREALEQLTFEEIEKL